MKKFLLISLAALAIPAAAFAHPWGGHHYRGDAPACVADCPYAEGQRYDGPRAYGHQRRGYEGHYRDHRGPAHPHAYDRGYPHYEGHAYRHHEPRPYHDRPGCRYYGMR